MKKRNHSSYETETETPPHSHYLIKFWRNLPFTLPFIYRRHTGHWWWAPFHALLYCSQHSFIISLYLIYLEYASSLHSPDSRHKLKDSLLSCSTSVLTDKLSSSSYGESSTTTEWNVIQWLSITTVWSSCLSKFSLPKSLTVLLCLLINI